MSREDYIDGYLNGVIGYEDDWQQHDVDLVLGRVLKPEAFGPWWVTKIPKFDMETPYQRWFSGRTGKKEVIDLAISYLDTSFS